MINRWLWAFGSIAFIAGEAHQSHSISAIVWSFGICLMVYSVIRTLEGQ